MKRKTTKKKIKKCLNQIEETLGYSFSWKKVSFDYCTFEIAEIPDFIWGIWMTKNYGINPAFFGQLRWFYDKFRPSSVEYSYTNFNDFLDFIKTFKGRYKNRVIELIREGNFDYDGYLTQKDYHAKQSDEELWAEYLRKSDDAKFERTHFGLTREDYQKAFAEKEDTIKFLKDSKYVTQAYYYKNGKDKYSVYFRLGFFKVLLAECTPKEIRSDIYDKLWNLKYNTIGGPELYVGDGSDDSRTWVEYYDELIK